MAINVNFEKISDLAKIFIKHNDSFFANKLYQKLKELLSEHPNLKDDDLDLFNKYKNILIQLQFISLNFFEETDWVDLLKNNLNIAFSIEEFDLREKLRSILIFYRDFDIRDNLKKKFLIAVSNCKQLITRGYKIDSMPVKVSEWVNNLIINLGMPPFDLLKKQEYLTNNDFVKILAQEDKQKIRKLLDLYEFLSLSSNTKEGNENVVPMKLDDKFIILDQGNIKELNKELRDEFLFGSGDRFSQKTENFDKLLESDSEGLSPLNNSQIVNNKLEIGGDKNNFKKDNSFYSSLEASLKNYSPASLEYKAIKQELGRLERLTPKGKSKK